MKELPTTLKNELAILMHRDIIEQVHFLHDKDEIFVAFISPLMKAVKFQGDEYIYNKGSLIDEIFFLVRGKVGLVIPEFDDISYVNIHPNDYFGDIDYVCKDNDGKR
jgi:CRP-like cAMP-binding protein